MATHQDNQTLDQSEKHDQLRNEPSSNDHKSPAIPSRQSSSKVYIKLFPPERSTFSHFPQINCQVIWLIFVFFLRFPFISCFTNFFILSLNFLLFYKRGSIRRAKYTLGDSLDVFPAISIYQKEVRYLNAVFLNMLC